MHILMFKEVYQTTKQSKSGNEWVEYIFTITNAFQVDFGIPHPFMRGYKICIPSCNLKVVKQGSILESSSTLSNII